MESNPYSSPSANLFGSSSTGGEAVSEGAITQLQKTKPWVRLLSVMCFIGVVFMLVIGAVLGAFGTQIAAAMKEAGNPLYTGGMLVALGAFYALMGLLYLYPGVKLWKYANGIARLMNSRMSADLEAALNQQRGFWKFVGILIVIWLCLMVVGFGFAIVAGIMTAAGGAR